MFKRLESYLVSNWIGLLISLLFLLTGTFTLSHYGINSDEPIHFERGNAYLNFFLTGKDKYSDADFSGSRISEWKYRGYDAAYFIKNDSGHPPLNGIIATAFNRVLYEKLGIMGDLQSYHFFEVLVSSLLIFLVFAMVKDRYGNFAGMIASLSLMLYPLFYGESHFNIKDPVEASFYAFTLYFFYLGVERIKAKYFLISSLFCALAFGTKFNIVFIPFIILPYLFISRGYTFLAEKGKWNKIRKIPKSVYIVLIIYPLIVIGVHFLSRPFLWTDPINHFMQIVGYYKDIGTGMVYQARFIKYGFNIYPIFFVTISTPLIILFYFLIGVAVSLYKVRNNKDIFIFLILLWFVVIILRVSMPGASIYGGVRQIMEYIPPMAIIASLGALFLRDLLRKIINTKISSIIIIVTFIPLIYTLVRLHPNENLFMNSLIGGLKGASEQKIPGAGETFGNAYLQGILWLNSHAEENAHFGFPVGLGSNFPPQFLRKDIKFGPYFSGTMRSGEYMMEEFSVEFPPHRYTYDYLDQYLIPVYVKNVDGVPILKIWKNDIAHTKPTFLNEAESQVSIKKADDSSSFYLNLNTAQYVTRIEINYDNQNCSNDLSADFNYSSDGKMEFSYPDESPQLQGRYAGSLQEDNKLIYFFPATSAKWLHIVPHDTNSCLLNVNYVRVFSLKDIRP